MIWVLGMGPKPGPKAIRSNLRHGKALIGNLREFVRAGGG